MLHPLVPAWWPRPLGDSVCCAPCRLAGTRNVKLSWTWKTRDRRAQQTGASSCSERSAAIASTSHNSCAACEFQWPPATHHQITNLLQQQRSLPPPPLATHTHTPLATHCAVHVAWPVFIPRLHPVLPSSRTRISPASDSDPTRLMWQGGVHGTQAMESWWEGGPRRRLR